MLFQPNFLAKPILVQEGSELDLTYQGTHFNVTTVVYALKKGREGDGGRKRREIQRGRCIGER